MHTITNITRMWLTRSAKPFIFKKEYDRQLPFEECGNLGLYVHIPFCRSICDFCPYCKVLYTKEVYDKYIDALVQEIYLVGSRNRSDKGKQSAGNPKKKVTSLYFGGGTPALASDRIEEVIAAIREHYQITEGIGIELHPDNVTVPVLQTLKEAGVTKISIGIQSFSAKFQKILGRRPIAGFSYEKKRHLPHDIKRCLLLSLL